jgi:hypothetical protein
MGMGASTLVGSVSLQGAEVVRVDLGGWLAILPHGDRLAWLFGQVRRPGRRRCAAA